MSYRGIATVTLLKRGVVLCKDDQGRQSPPLQGLFREVIGQIREKIPPDSVTWQIFRDGTEVAVSFEEWLKYGEQNSVETLPVKQVDDEVTGFIESHPQINDLNPE